MRWTDLLGMGLSALYQQKVRTGLTLLGVIISTLVLALSVSIGRGIHDHVDRAFGRFDYLRRITLHSGFGNDLELVPPEELTITGTMSDAKRERLRRAKARQWRRKGLHAPTKLLTFDRLPALRQLDHVVRVTPSMYESCVVGLEGGPGQFAQFAAGWGGRQLERGLLAGRLLGDESGREVLVSEYLLYLWGVGGDDEARAAVGRTVRLEYFPDRVRFNPFAGLTKPGRELTPEDAQALAEAVRQLPALLDKNELPGRGGEVLRKLLGGEPRDEAAVRPVYTGAFVIAGVLAEPPPTGGLDVPGWYLDDLAVVLPQATAEDICAHSPRLREQGFYNIDILVDRIEHVEAVMNQVQGMGVRAESPLTYLRQFQNEVFFSSVATGLLAAIALLVAALGITNTMLMSVIERTREIGILKAVGARDRHVQGIFLVEAALLGVLGGGLGLFGSWLASFPLEGVAQGLLERQMAEPVEGTWFLFPAWLVFGAPAFTGLVTVLAAAYPARRAARVDPIQSLRHE